MASTDVKVNANTSLVIGAVLVAGGVLFVIYTIEQDAKNQVNQFYTDAKSLAHAPLDFLNGVGAGARRAWDWLTGDDRATADGVTPEAQPQGDPDFIETGTDTAGNEIAEGAL